MIPIHIQDRAAVYNCAPPCATLRTELQISRYNCRQPEIYDSDMLRLFAAMAPPVALLMVGVLLLEPPALTPRDRVPTLRLLTSPGPEVMPKPLVVSVPDPTPEPEPHEFDIVLPHESENSDDDDTTSSSGVESVNLPEHDASTDRAQSIRCPIHIDRAASGAPLSECGRPNGMDRYQLSDSHPEEQYRS